MATNPTDRDPMIEVRVAKLESDVGHIRTDIAEIRTDIREIRVDITAIRESIASAKIGGVLLYVALAGTLLLTLAKGFKWL